MQSTAGSLPGSAASLSRVSLGLGASAGQLSAAPSPPPSIPLGRSSLSLPGSSALAPLVEGLVVPEGQECALLIPTAAGGWWAAGQEKSFGVTDTRGAEVVGVVLCGAESKGGVQVSHVMLTDAAGSEVLASCSAQVGTVRGPLQVCRRGGEVFATLSGTDGRFVLAQRGGGQWIFDETTRGSLRAGLQVRLRVADDRGAPLAEVGPWGSGQGREGQLFVRVGPGVDAGALLCGLLAVLRLAAP